MRALKGYGLSERSACRVTKCPRSVAQYQPRRVEDVDLVERLKAIAMERRRFGYRRLTLMLHREGFVANHKRIYRIYNAHGLQVKTRKKRGVRHVRGNAIAPTIRPDERWSVDFVSDTLSTGRRFRALTIVDDFSRECIGIEVDFSLTGTRVANVFTRLAVQRGRYPITMRLTRFPGHIDGIGEYPIREVSWRKSEGPFLRSSSRRLSPA